MPARKVFEVDWTAANAFAFPIWGWVVYTRGADESLSDDELVSIAAHELGHLTEGRAITALRYARALIPLPLFFSYRIFAAAGVAAT